MKNLYRILAFITVLTPAFPVSGVADDGAKSFNPSLGWVVKGTPEVDVKVDKKRETVSVTVNHDSSQTPQSLGMTFYDAAGNATSLELKATEPPTVSSTGQARSQFAGTLGPAAQSYVGFEIRIPLGSESPTLVHSEELPSGD